MSEFEQGPTSPEFSVPLDLEAIGDRPTEHALEADADSRAALARRFAAVSIEHLTARLTVRIDSGDVLINGRIDAAVVRTCVVTLEPFIEHLNQPFRIRFRAGADLAPPSSDGDIALGADDEDIEPLDGETIDLGECVAQQVALALAPHPRKPDARIDESAFSDPRDANPFAALKALDVRKASRDDGAAG